ncbi:protein ABSCISIC ACID-INSENSITIVE 5-like isoform X2 [Prosopis cineraria]|uniref:protein ABSCISIC ACID-INSENSITIVE 5-like isoform X2 n=1 Tax=Prosopis cineraria TaxID=364024 RepID=UPI00240F8917|nr:protein ABSCISIC ACID-INSENSITIVE 5-like isoform X2 [Prosopis cineraria]XP_054802810.1 protein ABSCISIC ACID-INSENSITIVE 5-like isoform X2 [Prosopis cineraria]
MGMGEVETTNSQGEVESSPKNNHSFSSLGRQSSIYSLTLDEFQHTLCESGKNFGSMNMDEFLSSIWNAEESQAINSNHNTSACNNNNTSLPLNEASAEKGVIRKQLSLPRQGSLTLPAPLCRKTVDEVWSEIHRAQQGHQGNSGGDSGNALNNESAPRQPTFGEMTLEDFLIKAGVVRESCAAPMPAQVQGQVSTQPYGMYPNNNSTMGPSFVSRTVLAGNVVPPYQTVAQGEPSSGYAGNGKRNNGYPPPPPPSGVCYGGRVLSGGGGYGAAAPTMAIGAPLSPVSSDGLGTNENCGNQFGVEMGLLRGRKRIVDGPVEKVVERRQRRMIKNRESAARSRARKQAYTVELEAELNQLREENANLKLALVLAS